MNKANLKSYAPQARKDFIAAVTAPDQTQSDVTVIAGQAWPVMVSDQRIHKDGFVHTTLRASQAAPIQYL